MKHQSSVGGRIDVRCGSPASNVRAAYKQWMVTKGVRDLDPDFRPAGAGMHDEAQALVPEALETPGMNGCGAVAHVPIHRLPWASTACVGLIAGFLAAFCAIVGMDSSPMRVQVMVFAISLFMGPAPQKCLAGTNIFRRLMAH